LEIGIGNEKEKGNEKENVTARDPYLPFMPWLFWTVREQYLGMPDLSLHNSISEAGDL
jgi:hypothetical protein